MTSFLIDVNVWLALTWDGHAHYQNAERWNQSHPNEKLLFCRFTMLGLIRLLTTKAIMLDRTLAVSEALDVYENWLQDPRVQFRQEPQGTGKHLRTTLESIGHQQAPKAIADCYLVAFAQRIGASLVTFDQALAQLGKHHNIQVELLPAS